MALQSLPLIFTIFNFSAGNPGFRDWPKLILPLEAPQSSGKVPKPGGPEMDPKMDPSQMPKKLQPPLNSMLFRASGLPIRYPILDPFWGPDPHFLKEILKDLINI